MVYNPTQQLYLFIVRLHTEEDGVRGETSQAALQVRLPPELLRFCIQVVQSLDGLLKLLLVNLKPQPTAC